MLPSSGFSVAQCSNAIQTCSNTRLKRYQSVWTNALTTIDTKYS